VATFDKNAWFPIVTNDILCWATRVDL